MNVEEDASTGDISFVYKPADNGDNISQNDFAANIMTSYIKFIDSTINGGGYNLSPEEMLLRAVGKDQRVAMLYTKGFDQKILKDIFSHLNNYIQASLDLSSEDEIKVRSATEKRNFAQANIDRILKGEEKHNYAERIAFFLSPQISSSFYPINIYQYALGRGYNYKTADQKTKEMIEKD